MNQMKAAFLKVPTLAKLVAEADKREALASKSTTDLRYARDVAVAKLVKARKAKKATKALASTVNTATTILKTR